jgi:hypothetical protein
MSTPAAALPTTFEAVVERLSCFDADDIKTAARRFVPAPTDIIIGSHQKCGTTWLQQILHGLRTGGSMAFADIGEVVPFLDIAPLAGIDLNAPQIAAPRLFKSHLGWHDMPKGARYVVSLREPKDMFTSYYHFWSGSLFQRGAMTPDAFVDGMLAWRGNHYWRHLASWWEHRDDPNVLLLCYEHLQSDLGTLVRRIARFMGIEADAARIDTVIEQASIDFMSRHRARFADAAVSTLMERACGFTDADAADKATGSTVRRGRTGEHRHTLSAQTCRRLDEIWAREIAAPLGLDSYDALLREQLARASRHGG